MVIGLNGINTSTLADGTVITSTLGPDQRFGMQAPIVTNLTTSTPGGLTANTTFSRVVNPSDLVTY